MKFELPKLPYGYDALEPHIDARTMEIHHSKHHQGYVDKLNAALEKYPEWQNKSLEEILTSLNSVPGDIRAAVRNNAGGHLNHSLFWKIMGPADKGGEGEPQGELFGLIRKTFGNFEKFKEDLTSAGLNRFGSGWVWLVVNNGALEVCSTPNQDNPLTDGKIPLFGVDLWEHSYYLLYQWRRGDYLQNWWKIVNWRQVEENYKKAS